MQYKGKLYGKIGGKYFDLEKTADDFDKLESQLYVEECQNEMLIKEIDSLKNLLNGVLNLCDSDNPSHECIWRHVYAALN